MNDAWYSTDGAAWMPASLNTPFAPRRHHSSAAFNGVLWVIGGNDNNGGFGDVWHSP